MRSMDSDNTGKQSGRWLIVELTRLSNFRLDMHNIFLFDQRQQEFGSSVALHKMELGKYIRSPQVHR